MANNITPSRQRQLAKAEFYIEETATLLAKRELQEGGAVQKYIDSEVLRLSDRLIPLDTGVLKNSGIRNTVLGKGNVVYKTPYARAMYYGRDYNFHDKPNRGAYWFERMKTAHKQSILDGANKIAGGE